MTCMLVVACMIFRCLPVPPRPLTAGGRRGLLAMIVVAVLAHSVASSIVDDRPFASGTGMHYVRQDGPA
jgi:hypothetical protein